MIRSSKGPVVGQYIKTIVQLMIKALCFEYSCIYAYGTLLDMEALVVALLVNMTTVYKIDVIQALIDIEQLYIKRYTSF